MEIFQIVEPYIRPDTAVLVHKHGGRTIDQQVRIQQSLEHQLQAGKRRYLQQILSRYRLSLLEIEGKGINKRIRIKRPLYEQYLRRINQQ